MINNAELIEKSTDQLKNIMDISLTQQMKDLAKKALGRSVHTKDPMFWPAGMLMLGLSEAKKTLEYTAEKSENPDEKLENINEANKIVIALTEHVDLWREEYKERIDFIDDSFAGVSLAKLYEESEDEKLEALIDKLKTTVMEAPKDSLGSIIYNPGKKNKNIFADGIGQSSMFLAAHLSAMLEKRKKVHIKTGVEYYNESDYIKEIAVIYTQIMNFYNYGRDKRSGLIYHGYSLNEPYGDPQKTFSCDKKGILGWGRAVGWLMLGLSEAANLEKKLESDNKTIGKRINFSLSKWYNEMILLCLNYQREDGGWSWQIEAMEGHIDMSATGMIAYAIAKGLEYETIEDKGLISHIEDALKKAEASMLQHIEKGLVTDALSSCDDFAVHYQTYGNYPWGQGAVLAALSVIERTV